MLAREEWLGCRHDASPMVDIPGSTPVWAQYIYFWFLMKNLYVLCFKIYMYYKRTLVVPDVVLTRRRSGNDFDRPWCFLKRNGRIHRFIVIASLKSKLIYMLDLYTTCMTTCYYILNLSFSFMLSLWLYLSITEHMVCLHSYCFLFTD